MAAPNVTVADHPLIQHKLTLLRRVETSTVEFRQLLREIALLLAFEATRDLPMRRVRIETPLEEMEAPALDGMKLCLVSILRAGNGLLEGMLDLIPAARVGHIGMYRDHDTLEAVEYYLKLPHSIGQRQVIVVDPMLATGNSAVAAVTRLKEAGAKRIKFVALVAAPEGIEAFATAHPDVPILTAAIDRQLSEIGYILPGLGDAGDRLYGTK
jgi:uracil phosphoribosyltransferase